MQVRLLRPFNGAPVNAIVNLDNATANALIGSFGASLTLAGGFPWPTNQPFQGVVQPPIELASREWTRVPSIFRLRLVGTGTAVVDSRNRLSEETLDVESYDAIDATDQIEFPYLGDNAFEIRVTFPETLKVEVM